MTPAPHRRPLWLRMLAALLLAQIVWVQAMASRPELHRAIHHDADQADHDCGVVALLAGGWDSTLPTAMVTAAPQGPVCLDQAPPVDALLAPCHLIGGIAAHAPPRAP